MRRLILTGIVLSLLLPAMAFAQTPQEKFKAYCAAEAGRSGQCPQALCEMRCEATNLERVCIPRCVPKPCTVFSAGQCPAEYCTLMTACTGKKICHYPMAGEKVACGNLAYAGQDVDCCPGLIRRCGYEFFDGSCDLEGQNSIYNIPICIPCGDGVCGQFEDRCNCPEDCHPRQQNTEPVMPLSLP